MRLAALVIAALTAASAVARADEDAAAKSTYRVAIDRVDLEPASFGGLRLRVYVTALSLYGQLLDLTDPKAIKLHVGTSELKAPYALGSYAALGGDTAIVVVVQATGETSDLLKIIGEALDQNVFAKLGDRVQGAILPYGETIATGKLAPVKQVRGKLLALESDDSAGEPLLLETLERALMMLKKAKTEPEGRPLRKMILVIGDGRDQSADRERVTRLGTRAAKEGVRIHTFAFSPNDVRRPLLLLGELSKRSHGTFRWLRRGRPEGWPPAFQQLHDEIDKQYVLTYFVPKDADVAGRKIKIVTSGRADVTSNEVKVPEAGCNGVACETGYCAANRCVVPRGGGGRGVLGWILMIGGIVLGALFVLGVIGYVITKRQQQAAVLAGGMPPGAMPGMFPPGVSLPPQFGMPPPPQMPMAMPPPIARPQAVAAPPTSGPRFYVLSGPLTGQTVALRHGFTIGKAPGNDLLIDDGYTSGQHAQIGMDQFGNCRLYDRGSTNGTFVNGVRVTDYALVHGTSVRIGSTELRFLAQ